MREESGREVGGGRASSIKVQRRPPHPHPRPTPPPPPHRRKRLPPSTGVASNVSPMVSAISQRGSASMRILPSAPWGGWAGGEGGRGKCGAAGGARSVGPAQAPTPLPALPSPAPHVGRAPRRHDERVVHRHADDDLGARRAQLVIISHIARQVHLRVRSGGWQCGSLPGGVPGGVPAPSAAGCLADAEVRRRWRHVREDINAHPKHSPPPPHAQTLVQPCV